MRTRPMSFTLASVRPSVSACKQAEDSAELAANTVTSLIDLVSLGHVEALAVVHEYLNGHAESPLGEIFRNWTKNALNKHAGCFGWGGPVSRATTKPGNDEPGHDEPVPEIHGR